MNDAITPRPIIHHIKLKKTDRIKMAIPSVMLNFLFPPPPSLFVSTMSVIGLTSLSSAGYMEIKGKHMQYSKFLNVGVVKKEDNTKLSSRNGMLFSYTPAFLVGLASLLVFHDQDLRFMLLASALTAHFLKRVFEVHPILDY